MEIIEAFAAKNKCYQAGAALVPRGIMLHSIGCPQPSAAALAQKLGKADVADYITAQGTTGVWTWRKWASGIAEMWAVFGADTLEMTAQTWGDLYTASWMGVSINKSARQ